MFDPQPHELFVKNRAVRSPRQTHAPLGLEGPGCHGGVSGGRGAMPQVAVPPPGPGGEDSNGHGLQNPLASHFGVDEHPFATLF